MTKLITDHLLIAKLLEKMLCPHFPVVLCQNNISEILNFSHALDIIIVLRLYL